MKKSFISVLALGMCINAYAGGFRVSVQGVKQAAAGHTGVASTHDASAIFFNPGALALQDKKWSISVSAFGIKSKAEYQNVTNGSQAETDNDLGTPFSAFVSTKLNDKIAVGLGVYTPYGNTVNWGKNWSGQNLIQDIELQAIFVQPTVSYKLNDWASVGAGLIYAFGGVELNRAFLAAGDINLKSDQADGLGYNLGLHLKPSEKVSVGLNYRSKVKMEAEGKAKVTSNQDVTILTDEWSAELPLASEITVGISYKPIPKLTLNYDMHYTKWSAYESLDFDFSGTTIIPDSSSKRDYSDTFTYRIGAAYEVSKHFIARVGAYYDETPSPSEYFSPETPTLTNQALTTGFSYILNNGLSIDTTYMYLNGMDRSFSNVETNWSGDIKATTHIFGLGASYNF